MASFEIAHELFMKTQGMYPYSSNDKRFEGTQILCSDCFSDEGLRLDAFRIGIENDHKCPNCFSEKGRKLTKQIVRELCYQYFVRGTIQRFKFGGCPLIQMNEERFNESDIKLYPSLLDDTKLIERAGEIGLFYYSPKLWMLGEITPLKNLQKEDEIEKVIERIIKLYSKYSLTEKHSFYRLRVNPKNPDEFSEYDSPPPGCQKSNRLNINGNSVLYCSPDLELCLHECRATAEDELYVAKLVPKKTLTIIDLSELLVEEKVSEFESLDLSIHFLFLAGSHSYSICSMIAERIEKEGIDGIMYPSYFSHIRTGTMPFETISGISPRMLLHSPEYVKSQTVPNLALFGSPIKEGKILVHSINKVLINSIKYDVTFGPANIGDSSDEKKHEEYFIKERKKKSDKLREEIKKMKEKEK